MLTFKTCSRAVKAKYCEAIIYTLRMHGGLSTREQVHKNVITMLGITENEMNIMIDSGSPKIVKTIDWCKFILKRDNIIDDSDRGIWCLTSKGERFICTEKVMSEIIQRIENDASHGAKELMVDEAV